MPQVELPKPPERHWSRTLLKLGAVLLAVALVGYVVWRLVPTAATSVKQADALDANGKYQESYAKLHNAYTRAVTGSDKALILSRLAPVTENLGRHDEALTYYTELDHRQPHQAGNLVAMGNVAVELGRKDVALAAYREALDLEKAEPQGPRTQVAVSGLTSLISQLEGQQ